MKLIRRIKKVITSPKSLIQYFMATRPKMFSWMSDEQYIKFEYKLFTGMKLNLENPKRFNEKLQWLKLYDHNPQYTTLVDKQDVKSWVTSVIGEEYVIPSLGVWSRFEDIDFNLLPEQFILKCTHDSGGNIICTDKNTFDRQVAKKKIDACMKKRYFLEHREWPYKNVEPRIIAEPLLVDEPGKSLKDYKLFCFHGITEFLFVASDRGKGTTKFDFYDKEFNRMPVAQHYPNSENGVSKPQQFVLMKELAFKLAKDIPFVRVDFYEVKGQVFFGELTFCHFAGIETFEPDSYDFEFGKLIDLNEYGKAKK